MIFDIDDNREQDWDFDLHQDLNFLAIENKNPSNLYYVQCVRKKNICIQYEIYIFLFLDILYIYVNRYIMKYICLYVDIIMVCR